MDQPPQKPTGPQQIVLPAIIADVAPELAANPPSVLSRRQVEHLLIQAIYARQVLEVARAVLALTPQFVAPEGWTLAQKAVATSESIMAYNTAEQARMQALLTEAGIAVLAGNNQRTAAGQIHSLELRVKPTELNEALAVSRADGYLQSEVWQRGAWQSVLRTRTKINLIKADAVTTRLSLRWRERGPRSRWERALEPADVDYRLIDLPTGLWFLYPVVKYLRLAATQLFGRRYAGQQVPFLGTPTDLIPALLDAAAVTTEDVVMDLGCGDGRILVEAARLRGCYAVGVEQDATLVELARARIAEAALDDRVQVTHGDIRQMNLDDVSVVFLFLPVDVVGRLLPNLRQQLKPGARIIIHEQTPLDPQLQPDRSMPLFSPSAMTVAHGWTVA